jgi:hypothetical protein
MWARRCPHKKKDEVVVAWTLAMQKVRLSITLQQLKIQVVKIT